MDPRRRRFFAIVGVGGAGGGETTPSVALQFDVASGKYQFVIDNALPPDAFMVLNGSNVEVQAGATSGLTMLYTGGHIQLQTA